MADPFLDGKPMKLSKNGSDVIWVFWHFMTVLAAAFSTACGRLIFLFFFFFFFFFFWGGGGVQSRQKAIAVV